MQKHRTHQIDDLANRVLIDALPLSWVANKQEKDYAKDYLVEIGEDDGILTGCSFYIQLKGKERAVFSADRKLVKYSLESKYARYYVKIKDLPVFLFVVDINKKKGWWLFLQPVLDSDQSWKRKRNITVSLPAVNDIADTAKLRKAIEEAKRWMRLRHPLSIHDSVVAHKERIIAADPRFDVNVSLVNDHPMFTLLAKEDVPLKFTFAGDRDEMSKKVSDLLDKGVLVTFQPGEVKVTGSKLFDPIEHEGCAIQASVDLASTLTLTCYDAQGRQLACLNDVPGQLSGGRKELWFNGTLVNSPLSIELGPLSLGVGGSLQVNLNLRRWNDQRLLQLAFFNRLDAFFQALPESSSTTIECRTDGNCVFSTTLPLQSQPFALPLASYFRILSKARAVAQRFNVNPNWSDRIFDESTQEAVEQLHAIFFGDGWSQPMPRVRLTANCIRKSFRFDLVKQTKTPERVQLNAAFRYKLFGETIEVGRLVQAYTGMSVEILTTKGRSTPSKRKTAKAKVKASSESNGKDTVKISMVGSKETVMTLEQETSSRALTTDSMLH